MKPDRGVVALAVIAVLLVSGAIVAIVAVRGDDDVPTRGISMMPTLDSTDDVDVDFGAYRTMSPRIGDVVALQAPSSSYPQACEAAHPPGSPCPEAPARYTPMHLIKRVVALPGDEIAFAADGTVIRNGSRADEPYIFRCSGECALPVAITVPPGHVFVAGDNRPVSSDSRIWGSVPAGALEGKVLLER